MVDASNEFNSLNRRAALFFSARSASSLFIDGTSLLSQEGTTQGDPLAMPMYAISIVPVVQQLKGLARQVWYADDAAAGGSLLQLQDWWSGLLSFAPHFGYHVNVAKTWLVVKEECLVSAQRVFGDSGIQITSAGWPYLGAALGSSHYIRDYTQDRITNWTQGLSRLSSIAASQPTPLTQCLCTDSLLNGTTFCVLIQIFMIFYLLLSPLFTNNFYLHWFPTLLVTWSVSCSVFLHPLEVWGFVILIILQGLITNFFMNFLAL